MSQPQQPSSNPNTNPVINYIQEWNERTPFVTKYTVIILIISYILSWIFQTELWLANAVYFTFFKGEIYRIFLSPLVGNSILMLILGLIMFIQLGYKMETGQGSFHFLYDILLISITTNIFYNIVCLILYAGGMQEAVIWPCMGFFFICFGLLAIECMQFPDMPRKFLCFPYDIPSKYYPVILYAIFTLFGADMASFIAMCLGYLYGGGYVDRIFKLSTSAIDYWEQSSLLSRCTRLTSYVPSSSALGIYNPVNQVDRESYAGGSSAGGGGGWGMSNGTTAGGSTHHDVRVPNPNKRIHGFGDLTEDTSSGSNADKKTTEHTAFSGAGHRLSDTSSSTATTTPSFLTPFSGGTQIATTTVPLSREDLAKKRLEALKSTPINNTASGNSNSTHRPSNTLENV